MVKKKYLLNFMSLETRIKRSSFFIYRPGCIENFRMDCTLKYRFHQQFKNLCEYFIYPRILE